MELITNVGLIMIPELIFVVTRYPHNCVPGLIVRELFTSSGIPNIIMTWLAPLIALPAPFIYASFHPASHVATATIFLCNAAATGACFEFLIAKLLVQLSNYVIIGQLNVAGLSLVHFQLALKEGPARQLARHQLRACLLFEVMLAVPIQISFIIILLAKKFYSSN
jgi:hypothetical protein